MNLLAIETSSAACSVALSIDDSITGEHVIEPRAHTRILMPMIHRLLGDAGVNPTDLDAVVLGNGPGSFIGMRIGASVAQGIGFAAGIGLIPLSSLAAVAADAFARGDAERVIVTQDARMREVYVGIYDRDETGLPLLVGDEYIASVSEPGFSSGAWEAVGGGWRRYPELLTGGAPAVRLRDDCQEPNAQCLLVMAASGRTPAIAPDSLVPAYLRQKVADAPTRQA